MMLMDGKPVSQKDSEGKRKNGKQDVEDVFYIILVCAEVEF